MLTEARAIAPEWTTPWPDVHEDDVQAVARQLSSGQLSLTSGGILQRFEKRFATFAGAKHAGAVNNGTASLYAALWACGVGPGDDVLLCDYGFHGMAAAVLALGARVVPVDCDAASLTMSPEDAARARTPQTKAALVHHPWGAPADLQALREALPGLPIVSDASHAHGATLRGKPLAAWADVTCFSLGLQKLITGGELGCAVTDDPTLRDRMLIFGHVNRVPRDLSEPSWDGNAVGLKLRPHVAALTLAYAQIPRYEHKKSLLVETCAGIERALEGHGLRPQAVPPDSQRVYWRIVLHADADTEPLLRAAGFPVEPNHYWPLLQDQSLFQWPGNEDRVARRPCPTAREVVPRLVTLPAPVQLPAHVLDTALANFSKVGNPLPTPGVDLPQT
ncbi:MAG: aminotransferase class I/II-fold pyridoxal phosphate-dependent enzyme [Armatimonadetes bacterium]|nr:aminotransferase class I/II-fold pyridoxal phosphate-dependent enzyme [Armatimonadota bacterium]